MPEPTFQPNWACPPGETIAAILKARALPFHWFCEQVGLAERETLCLLQGKHPIDSALAVRLSATIGSTPRFWIHRERKFQSNLKALEARRPVLEQWFRTFPVSKMREMGWLPRQRGGNGVVFELLDFFAVSSIEEWQERYVSRLEQTKFRTSASIQNSVSATTAWLRRGEMVAEEIHCQSWNKRTFQRCLTELKPLSKEASPRKFLPELQKECAKHGVAVVVERCPTGCSASGATLMLEYKRALLLLSARFLSDDHFWFSFFHEAGHLVLHGESLNIEAQCSLPSEREVEANLFAQKIILAPEGEDALRSLPINKFSIGRLAKRCGVSPGIIVGQLQNRDRVSPSRFNGLKVRYKVADFNREN
jgi:Zn-dependent peptidase ImmA (M78 family)/plasmid maintenance system antidote protein VapI